MNNPELWDSVLARAPIGSVLMGGAIRDWYCDKEAKDFDVFYPYRPGRPHPVGWVRVDRPEPALGQLDPDYDIVADGQLNPIACVYDYDVPFGLGTYRVQLVGVHYNNPLDHIVNFDHTLTLGAYSTNGLYIDHDLIESVRFKTVRILNNAKPEKTQERITRAIHRIDPERENDWLRLNA